MKLHWKLVGIALLGSAIQAFGIYHIHSQSFVTEGGGLGLSLLLQYWFAISPAITTFVLNVVCYSLGAKILGKHFVLYSLISTAGFSAFYAIIEQFPPLFPNIAQHPFIAAISGALCIGIGAGLCILAGGATSSDDAIAMSLSKIFNLKIQNIYLVSDLIVLLLSLTYIPFTRIFYSLITVILSGQIIGIIQDKFPTAN